MASAFNLTAQLNLQGPANVGSIVQNIKKQLGNISANVNINVNPQTGKNITALNSAFKNFNATLGQTRIVASDAAKAISSLSQAVNAAGKPLNSLTGQIQTNIQATAQLAKNLQNAQKQTNRAGSSFEDFGRRAGQAVKRFTGFAAVTGLVYKFGNALNAASKEFVEFNKEIGRAHV